MLRCEMDDGGWMMEDVSFINGVEVFKIITILLT